MNPENTLPAGYPARPGTSVTGDLPRPAVPIVGDPAVPETRLPGYNPAYPARRGTSVTGDLPPLDIPVAGDASDEPAVRVYNKSSFRTILHEPYHLAPSSFLNVPASVAERWYRLFPDEVVEAGVAQKELGGVTAELVAARARIAELEKSVIKPDAKAELVLANARVAKLEAELAKVDQPETSVELVAARQRIVQLEKEQERLNPTNPRSDVSVANKRIAKLETELAAAKKASVAATGL